MRDEQDTIPLYSSHPHCVHHHRQHLRALRE
jgi:hypothetical protein